MSSSSDVFLAHSGDGFTISRVVVGPVDNNAYLLRSDATGEGVVIDAAADVDALLRLVEGTRVVAIVTTHGHWDHHQDAFEFGAAIDAVPQLHPLDMRIADKPFATLTVGRLQVGDVETTIVHTPGHTPGSVCVLAPGVVLTGDTLFPGGPGATRFDHSSFEHIIESIRTELFTLPHDLAVLPGHGDATTIGTERDHLQEWIDRGW